jgi:hypothetical protein
VDLSLFGERFISFPLITMGQYFRAVNKTKKEVVCPWCMGVDGHLKDEDVAHALAAFVLLFHRPHANCDGHRCHCDMQAINVDPEFSPLLSRLLTNGLPEAPAALPEGLPIGTWSGDEVYLVSDYDCDLYQESFWYSNISQELADTWNSVVDDESLRLAWDVDCGCEDFMKAHR